MSARLKILAGFFLVMVLAGLVGVLSPAQAQQRLWPDLAQVVALLGGQEGQAAHELALRMQAFVQSPAGNQSLALQAMTDVQHSLLCLYAVQGPAASETARVLSQKIVAEPMRAQAFMEKQSLILGQEIPFDPNPENWKRYCPFPVQEKL